MGYVDMGKLKQCYGLLARKVAERNSSEQFEKIPFHSGYVWAEEGYKYSVWSEARNAINAIPWEEPGLVGSGKIKAGVLNALRANVNLLDWSDIIYFDDIRKGVELERALYNLYVPDSSVKDELSFNALLTLIKNKYALLSYLFFVKDKENYMVMRPNNFAWRLKRIGVKENCAFPASWRNYAIYMEALKETKDFLSEQRTEDEDITLLDAHSFVWMFWMIE